MFRINRNNYNKFIIKVITYKIIKTTIIIKTII